MDFYQVLKSGYDLSSLPPFAGKRGENFFLSLFLTLFLPLLHKKSIPLPSHKKTFIPFPSPFRRGYGELGRRKKI
jgi:hypothetical protein